MKDAAGFKVYPILLIALLLACTVILASCFGDSSNSSPASLASNTQASAITPVGAPATCLTVNSPSLVKLADRYYQLVDAIDNCGVRDAGPLQITAQIEAGITKLSTNLIGPATIPAHGKAMYSTSRGKTSETNKEIHFLAPSSPSAVITVLVMINGAVQGEWDGQVTIPGF